MSPFADCQAPGQFDYGVGISCCRAVGAMIHCWLHGAVCWLRSATHSYMPESAPKGDSFEKLVRPGSCKTFPTHMHVDRWTTSTTDKAGLRQKNTHQPPLRNRVAKMSSLYGVIDVSPSGNRTQVCSPLADTSQADTSQAELEGSRFTSLEMTSGNHDH